MQSLTLHGRAVPRVAVAQVAGRVHGVDHVAVLQQRRRTSRPRPPPVVAGAVAQRCHRQRGVRVHRADRCHQAVEQRCARARAHAAAPARDTMSWPVIHLSSITEGRSVHRTYHLGRL
jgi:hypothetical protein